MSELFRLATVEDAGRTVEFNTSSIRADSRARN